MQYWKEDIQYDKEYDKYYATGTFTETTAIEHNIPIKDFDNLSDAQQFIIDIDFNHGVYRTEKMKKYPDGTEYKDIEEKYLRGELYVMEVYANDLQF